MTIIQLNKNNHKMTFLISILMIVSIVSVLWGIFIYNQLVNIRHNRTNHEASIRQAEVTNAELKNNLYSIIDAKNLEPLINTQSLILDKDPEYTKSHTLVTAEL